MRNQRRADHFEYRIDLLAAQISFVNYDYYHNLLQFHNLQMVIVKVCAHIQSDIEPEHDNIAILHFIGLAFQPDGSIFAGSRIAAGFD